MSGHTKGPWEVTPIHVGDPREGLVIRDYATIIAEVHGLVDHPMNLANARLIAAAPAMLEALKAITGGLSDEHDMKAMIFASEVKQARAAIALATEGETK